MSNELYKPSIYKAMQKLCSGYPPNFLNQEIFGQLLELEDDEPGFLKELVSTWINQSISTLENLKEALYFKGDF